MIFVDGSLVEPLAKLAPSSRACATTSSWATATSTRCRAPLSYEQLLEEAGEGEYAWPDIHERAAAALCYTSGTTGNPKGVLYSHRSVSLHSTTLCPADAVGLSSPDRVLAIVPMFHVNAWGLPFGAALTGAELLLPGPYLQGEPLARFVGRSARRCSPACRRCSGPCSTTSMSTAATSARCAAGSAAARRCRASSWRASSATACASCRRGG